MMTMTMTMTTIISHNFKTTKQEGQSEIENLNYTYFNHFNAQKQHMHNILWNFCEFTVFI
jgi:hypothetical protein